ncbi:hypothetical protein B0O99DRAFT_681487 [Bisporella sp. PMI_857]|nr:hypothetical protein B0O99DRAFT_681487 [Bisporella sp. PMI_857]
MKITTSAVTLASLVLLQYTSALVIPKQHNPASIDSNFLHHHLDADTPQFGSHQIKNSARNFDDMDYAAGKTYPSPDFKSGKIFNPRATWSGRASQANAQLSQQEAAARNTLKQIEQLKKAHEASARNSFQGTEQRNKATFGIRGLEKADEAIRAMEQAQ